MFPTSKKCRIPIELGILCTNIPSLRPDLLVSDMWPQYEESGESKEKGSRGGQSDP